MWGTLHTIGLTGKYVSPVNTKMDLDYGCITAGQNFHFATVFLTLLMTFHWFVTGSYTQKLKIWKITIVWFSKLRNNTRYYRVLSTKPNE